MFVTFSKQDFDEFMSKHYPNSSLSPFSPEVSEYIYLIPTNIPHIIVKVFSSIDTRTNISREYGSDALRVVLYNNKINRPISSPHKSHIKRMKNWRLYLKSAITELKNKVEFYNRTCPKCGNPLVHRISKRGDFFGCSSYPQCIYTEPFDKPKTHQILLPQQKITPKPAVAFSPHPELIKTISAIYNIPAEDVNQIKDKEQFRLLVSYAASHNWSKYGIDSEFEAKKRIIYILNKFAGTELTPQNIKVNWIKEPELTSQKEPFVIELSEVEHGTRCPNCSGDIKILQTHKDKEGEITHFDAVCEKCKQKITLLND